MAIPTLTGFASLPAKQKSARRIETRSSNSTLAFGKSIPFRRSLISTCMTKALRLSTFMSWKGNRAGSPSTCHRTTISP
jgi:hypothetical protein